MFLRTVRGWEEYVDQRTRGWLGSHSAHRGVGPLTAQALEVRYSERPMFTVEYHRMQQFLAARVRARAEVASAKRKRLKTANSRFSHNMIIADSRSMVGHDETLSKEPLALIDCL
jgi:hypothetical protein